ncbi:DsbA family protein [Sutcliffiella rhizosphaerae]|uniref:Disulfide bond formation protein D n=1 Tax=Sutcliffiella rhizosphaerae TaxID=2880967 RepID=A0ABM8YUM1_9BACI|nr:DsbA family protein [Sutcliffiella rhizosphaerae]CAG9623678.1 Disulfide bond formation protein D [Sutcliffiella rhizosphaerae]
MANKNNPAKILVIVTLIVAALIIAIVVLTQTNAKDETSFENIPNTEGQPVLGQEDAPVTIVEFGDFKCPACKAWGENLYPQLVNDYVDTGKVKFVYINVLFHGQESALGAAAAEAVWKQSPEAYWDFHKTLFDEQPTANHDALWITPEKLVEVASNTEGVDIEQFRADINSQEIIDAVLLDSELTEEFKIAQTPTIMVNDKALADPFDYEKMKELIESELEGTE